MLARVTHIASAIAVLLTAHAIAADDGPQFSFSAPAGWRLQPERGRYAYTLRRVSAAEPFCSVGVGREHTSLTPRAVQDATIAKLHTTLAGPERPIVRRSTLRSRGGIVLLRADVVYQSYTQPRYRRGDIFSLRQIIYTFRRDDLGYVYNIVCNPPMSSESFFDRALDDMARTITFERGSTNASNQAMQRTAGRSAF